MLPLLLVHHRFAPLPRATPPMTAKPSLPRHRSAPVSSDTTEATNDADVLPRHVPLQRPSPARASTASLSRNALKHHHGPRPSIATLYSGQRPSAAALPRVAPRYVPPPRRIDPPASSRRTIVPPRSTSDTPSLYRVHFRQQPPFAYISRDKGYGDLPQSIHHPHSTTTRPSISSLYVPLQRSPLPHSSYLPAHYAVRHLPGWQSGRPAPSQQRLRCRAMQASNAPRRTISPVGNRKTPCTPSAGSYTNTN